MSKSRIPTQYSNIQVTPGLQGFKTSAGFQKSSYLHIKQLPTLELQNTIEFQFYLQEILSQQSYQENNIQTIPLFSQYKSINQTKTYHIKLSLIQDTQQLYLQINTQSGELKNFTSKARILQHQWTHIVISRDKNSYQLFVNGFKDIQANEQALYFGELSDSNILFCQKQSQEQDQDDQKSPSINFQLDNLKLYNTTLPYYEISAISQQFTAGVPPHQYQLVCQNCKATQVQCQDNYHICSSFELIAGGYQLIRLMGWLSSNNQQVWSVEGKKQVLQDQSLKDIQGLGICCIDA